jgi:activator of HSP90 ATPase
MYFESKHKTEEGVEATGTIKVHEFNQDDEDDIQITITCEKPGDFV